MALFGVNLREGATARVASGVLPLGDVESTAGLEPGRPVRVLDRTAEVVASGLADPENGCIRLWAAGEARALDAGFLRERLRAAAALRAPLGLADGASAFRLVNAEGDGLGGLTADVYGPFVVVCALSRGLLPSARLLAEAALDTLAAPPLALRGAVLKVRGKDPQAKIKDEIVGERPPERHVVTELGVPYEVHLLGSLNTGLFCDMREHRRGLARFVAGKRVLNTFAYTGALSVAAARAGAAAVTSVDLSSGVLAWAKDNFRRAGLDPDEPRFRFEVSDVMRFLEGEAGAAEPAAGARAAAAAARPASHRPGYDVIILDPPTFSTARASGWSLKRDFPLLVEHAAALLPEAGGHLWASANAHKGSSVLAHVEEGLRRAGRRGRLLELGGPAPDFPTPLGAPENRHLEVAQVWVDGG